jgi:hypothetical protein
MTERKPPGVSFEGWLDRQIREATERGEFDNLPGAGKPLTGLDGPYDENWWLKQKLESEGLSAPLPPSLALRKRAHELMDAAMAADTEEQVRQIVSELNDEIRTALKKPLGGPPLNLVPTPVAEAVAKWRAERGG